MNTVVFDPAMRGSPSSPTTRERERERKGGHLLLNLIKQYIYTNILTKLLAQSTLFKLS